MSECEFCGCRLDSDFDTGEHLDSLSCAVALKRDRDRLRAENERLREDSVSVQEYSKVAAIANGRLREIKWLRKFELAVNDAVKNCQHRDDVSAAWQAVVDALCALDAARGTAPKKKSNAKEE